MDIKSTSAKYINQRKLFAWLWQGYLRRHIWILGLIVVLMMIEGSMIGGLAWMMQPLFDGVFEGGSYAQLWNVGAIVFGLFLARGILSVVHRVLMTKIAKESVADLQNDLLGHILRLDLGFFSRHAPGYLMERVNGDVQSVGTIWELLVRGAARDFIGLISLFAVMLSIDWLWTLVALMGAPLLLGPSLIAQRYTRKQAVKARDVAANMATRLNEALHGVSTIKLNGLESYYTNRYRTLTQRQIKVEVKTLFGTAVIPSLVDIMSGIGFAGVIIYGGYEIISGAKSIGQFMAFFSALGLAFEPLRRLAGITGLINAASVSIQRMQDIFDQKPKLLGPEAPKPFSTTGDIEFKNVSLSFSDIQVLDNISFVASAGKTTALVGASGAGKTTIFNALTRLYAHNSGEITVSGVSNAEVDPRALRACISVVSQDSLLFDETLGDNIILDALDVNTEKLEGVISAAHIADFLPSMPNGMDTEVGPRGSNLSGGQRQRVAIARALLRDTPILLLDEATSALDTKSEVLVQNALEKLSQDRTTLVIAHRLSTIMAADQIIVMDKGRIVERGTHEKLIAARGYYSDLCRLQFGGSDGR
ncbi:MAG: ABC transporter ATP-binding protein [Planktomarina sp.]|nr:ABC transporter ATP-binding protein [Planktomarina sp.]HAJ85082.1 ABC transporter ATP-binding protein [Paracoccaceae bacterium]|tara:strand:+ start:10844 stop:12613 length:1770 start_codon:yes stop_codon:yes gene_type:complete